jgi:phenylpropionate dioxygenase-like ring-hydroxylating dioxygenase large terminal subunit
MWFKHMQPDGPDHVRNVAAFCFPQSALDRPDFDEIIVNYHKRFDLVMDEDNSISEVQLRGMKNPLGVIGRFSPFEKGVHHFDNWVIDQVVGPDSVRHREAAE